VIGDPYTDAGEGNAKIDSIKLFTTCAEATGTGKSAAQCKKK
jgi:hypothetical protein